MPRSNKKRKPLKSKRLPSSLFFNFHLKHTRENRREEFRRMYNNDFHTMLFLKVLPRLKRLVIMICPALISVNIAAHGTGGFGAKIFVLRSEGVFIYVERAKTEIENDSQFIGEIRRISTLEFVLSSLPRIKFLLTSESFSVAPKCAVPKDRL